MLRNASTSPGIWPSVSENLLNLTNTWKGWNVFQQNNSFPGFCSISGSNFHFFSYQYAYFNHQVGWRAKCNDFVLADYTAVLNLWSKFLCMEFGRGSVRKNNQQNDSYNCRKLWVIGWGSRMTLVKDIDCHFKGHSTIPKAWHHRDNKLKQGQSLAKYVWLSWPITVMIFRFIKQIHTFTSNIWFEQRRFGLGCPSLYQVKGWGNPDRNVVAQTICCWWTCGFAWWLWFPSKSHHWNRFSDCFDCRHSKFKWLLRTI